MAATLDDVYKEKFEKITKSNFVAQAKWYLNAFWDAHAKGKADEIYDLTMKMTQMTKRGAAGCDLDEFEAHKFIELLGETLTVIELRERLRTIDVNNDKRMALTEYFLFKYPAGSIKALCESVQSEDDPEMKEAQRLCAEANAALQKALADAESARQTKSESDAKAKAAKAAEDAAKTAEAQAKSDFEVADGKRSVADAKAADADAKKKAAEAVEEELKAILAELKKQEDDHAAKIKELESIAGTPGVKGGQAAAELLKLKNENPLPLRKAQAEQGVVIKKAEKARKEASDAHDVAAAAAAEAKAAADAAEASKNAATAAAEAAAAATAAAEAAAEAATAAAIQAEAAADAAAQAVAAANAVVEELKKKCVLHGSIWFMEKEMAEAAKFMPKGKK